MPYRSHDDYIAQAPAAGRTALLAIGQTVERVLPQAERCIGYNMPAYRLERMFFYFAAFKNHIGVYPPLNLGALPQPAADLQWAVQLMPYRGPKGNLTFLYKQPLPLDLIAWVAMGLARQYHPAT